MLVRIMLCACVFAVATCTATCQEDIADMSITVGAMFRAPALVIELLADLGLANGCSGGPFCSRWYT